MEMVFWVSVLLIVATYFGYPLFLVIATITRTKPAPENGFIASVTLLIPAYNEEKTIASKLENSMNLDYPKEKLELMIISDGSTDKTEEICRKYSGSGVKLIIQEPRRGKMAALNRAIKEAQGDIVVFSDANTMYDKEAIKMLVRNFADEKIGCVCGNSVFKKEGKSSVESGFSVYMAYERFIWQKESLLKSLLVVDGAIYGIRKRLFSSINEVLADDFVNPLNIGAMGYGIVYEPEANAEEKAVSDTREEFRRKVRVTSQGYAAFLLLWTSIFKSSPFRICQYMVHKLIRWLVPIFLITVFISNCFLTDVIFYRCVFIAQIIFYLSAMIGYILEKLNKRSKLLYVPFYFCLINMASLVGLFRILTGPQQGTWEKAETTR